MDSGELMTIVTRRSFISASAATLAATKLKAATPDKLVYIGSTDNKDNGPGIHAALWSAKTGTLSNLRLVSPALSAGFLAAGNLGGTSILFAGHQAAPKVGALSSYRIAPSGDLTLINTVTTPNFDMVHLALDHIHACLIAASYGSGKVLSVKIAPDGHISAPVTELQLTGHGPNASRQSAPHAHGVAISPDNRFVLINDLGTDLITIYKLNADTAELTPNDPPSFKGAPGSGPRHLTFHPNGKWAYSVNELDSTLTLLNWDAVKGVLTQAATFPTLPPGGDVANNRAGEVIIDKTGRILYSCNRGAVEDLLVYTIGPDGHLTLASRLPLNGKEARHFSISPDGGFFVVAEQFSNQVAVFSRNPQTGILRPTDHHYEVATPSCILFV
jgi:6-phosphogluconolactonase